MKEEKKLAKAPPKKVPRKKLPALLKRTFSPKKFNRKIVKKFSIDADRDFFVSHFVKTEKGFRIPNDAEFTKRDFARIKALAKQIKMNKPVFRFVPFFACIAVVAALVFSVVTFRNIVAKKVMVSLMESIFKAKTEIGSVNIGIDSVSIHNWVQASEKDPMKNLFEFEKIAFDYNLARALRGQCIINTCEVGGVQANTGRETSGELPKKAKSEKSSSDEGSLFDFSKFVATDSNSIISAFSDLDPKNLLADFNAQMQTPEVAKQSTEEIKVLVEKWKTVPGEMQQNFADVKEKTETVFELDFEGIDSVEEIRTVITTITDAIKSSTAFVKTIETTARSIESDAKTVENVATGVSEAIKNDTALVTNQINKITSFELPDGKKFISQGIENYIALQLGQFYPVVKKAQSFMEKYQESAEKREAKMPSVKPKEHKRLSGTTFEFGKNATPSFLIRNVSGSGGIGAHELFIDIRAKNITNNYNLLDLPLTITADVNHGSMKDSGELLIDLRTKAENVVSAKYRGSNYPINMDLTGEDIPALPSIAGQTDFGAHFSCSKDWIFDLGVDFIINDAKITANAFEPQFVYDIYSRILGSISPVDAQLSMGNKDSFYLNVASSVDQQIIKALKEEINNQLTAIKNQLVERTKTELKKLSENFTQEHSEFTGINNLIQSENRNAQAYHEELTKLLKAAEEELKRRTEAEVKKQIQNQMDSNPELKKTADALKNIFGR